MLQLIKEEWGKVKMMKRDKILASATGLSPRLEIDFYLQINREEILNSEKEVK